MIVLLILFSQANWWPIHSIKGVIVEEEVSLIYDSNPFKYSPDDLRDFENGLKGYRFPIRTSDDLAIKFNVLMRGNGGLKWRIGFMSQVYTINGEKSFLRFSLSIQKGRFSIYYFYLPRFLIRYYPDPDSGNRAYLPCLYQEHRLNIGFNFPLDFRLQGGGGYRDYVKNFNEYDGAFFSIKLLSPSIKLMKNSVVLSYMFEDYEARATDEPGEKASFSDDPDISYFRHSGEIILRRKFNFLKRELRTLLKYRYRRMIFTTDKNFLEDPYHSGRVDQDHRIKCDFDITINRRLALIFGIYFIWRDVSSDALPVIDEVKNYNRFRILTGVKFTT